MQFLVRRLVAKVIQSDVDLSSQYHLVGRGSEGETLVGHCNQMQ